MMRPLIFARVNDCSECVLLTEESDDGPWENLAFELFEESFGKEKLSKQVQDLSYVRIMH